MKSYLCVFRAYRLADASKPQVRGAGFKAGGYQYSLFVRDRRSLSKIDHTNGAANRSRKNVWMAGLRWLQQ